MAGAQFPVWGERPRVKPADMCGVCAPVPPMPAHSCLTCLSLLRPGRGRHPRGADQGGFRAGGRRAAAALRGAGEDAVRGRVGVRGRAGVRSPSRRPGDVARCAGAVAAAREAGAPGRRGGPCTAGAALPGVRRRPADGLCPLATEGHWRPVGGLCPLGHRGALLRRAGVRPGASTVRPGGGGSAGRPAPGRGPRRL